MDKTHLFGEKPLLPLIAYALLAIGFYLALLRVDTHLKITAVNDCGKISSYQKTTEDKATVTYPIQEVYQECLKRKGITE